MATTKASISTKPWSDYSESDYTLEQYAAACLVKPSGKVSSKAECKLPVRTPDGKLNANGVHAAAAALAGARGGVDLTPIERSQAMKGLAAAYAQLGEKLPDSLKHSAISYFAAKHDLANADVIDRFLMERSLGDRTLSHADSDKDETPTTAVVVAIPRALDPIRLVGDEDKHATLLFFGETSTMPAGSKQVILDTLKKVSALSEPFGASIMGVQRLGGDVPPALVAMLDGAPLGAARDALLINTQVADYLKNTPQYPNYTPHVTLGYPDYAGENEIRKAAADLFRVRFDRLGLWWNGEKTEFSLIPGIDLEADASDQVAMSEKVGNFLAHFGVKGMKWGVRRTAEQLGNTVTALRKKASGSSGSSEESKGSGGSSGSSEEHLSADAIRFLKTEQKGSTAQMSDRELRAAVDRANMVKQYNDLVNPSANKSLQEKVQKLQLQKQYNQLTAELNPSRTQKVTKLVKKYTKAYETYQNLDKATGKVMSTALKEAVSGKTSAGEAPKHRS